MNPPWEGSSEREGKAPGRILNREIFLYLLDLEVKRARRYKNFFCILLLKITPLSEDNNGGLKSGYQKLTHLLEEEIRESDILGWLKEDRLAALLPYMDRSNGSCVKSRFESNLKYCNFADDGYEVVVDQICFPQDGTGSKDLMEKALGAERT